MEFKIVYPFESLIYGDSFKEAIKNFIKINHNLQIHKMIITDQNKHIQAQIKYYQQDGRNKVGINMFPTGFNYPVPIQSSYINPLIAPTYTNPLIAPTYTNPLITPTYTNSLLTPMSPISPVLNMPFIPTVINIPI
jgi:hypothetical protein